MTLDDRSKVALEVIARAVTQDDIDKEEVAKTVRATVNSYELELRIFAVAAAKRQVGRVVRLLNMLDHMEEEFDARLKDPEKRGAIDTAALLKLYATSQGNLSSTLEFIKRVMDQRIEVEQAQSVLNPLAKVADQNKDMPLRPSERHRMRTLLEGAKSMVTEKENENDDS